MNARLTVGLVCTMVLSLVLVAQPRLARAQQNAVDLTANVDSDTVEVGDTVTYSLRAMVHGGGSPNDPRTGNTPGFTVQNGSSMPVHMRTNNNGVIDEVVGLMTSWSLHAERVGTFSLGPASVNVGSARRSAAAVRVKVVERGKGPKKTNRRTLDPFGNPMDPFGSSPLDPFKSLFERADEREPPPPPVDAKLGMDAPREPIAFLHATIDKPRAVVGEQVTLSVYLYEDPTARQGRPGDVHEATATDFVKRSLIEDETRVIGVGNALIAGKVWSVKLVRKNALFPLKTGHLMIEPMSMTLPQARVGLRASETLYVDVGEPPVDGRPAGYAIGDVGDMSLQANVTPRTTTRDGAIGVTLELRGTGNLPGRLTLPTVAGVEWLEQQSIDKLGPLASDRFGGTRTLSYVVRLHQEGAIDLGEVRLPYFDPSKNAYATARATLGVVNVTPGGGHDAGVEQAEIVLGGLPPARAALEGPPPESFLADRPAFWFALFGSPLACALALGARNLFGRLRERRAAASPSLDRLAKERLAEAESAVKGDDGKAAMGAIARAVEACVLAETGVNLRGAASDVSRAELEQLNMTAADAAEIISIMRACEDARFSPDGVDGASARAVWERAERVLERIHGGGRKLT